MALLSKLTPFLKRGLKVVKIFKKKLEFRKKVILKKNSKLMRILMLLIQEQITTPFTTITGKESVE